MKRIARVQRINSMNSMIKAIIHTSVKEPTIKNTLDLNKSDNRVVKPN
jgi:hypothetical protein